MKDEGRNMKGERRERNEGREEGIEGLLIIGNSKKIGKVEWIIDN